MVTLFSGSVQNFAFSCTKRLFCPNPYRICSFSVRNTLVLHYQHSFGHILPSKCDRLLLRAPVPPDFFSRFSPNGREINHFSAAKGSLAENRSFFRPNDKKSAVSPENRRYFGHLAEKRPEKHLFFGCGRQTSVRLRFFSKIFENEKDWQQRKRKWSPRKLRAALPAVAAGLGVRPAAVSQCFCLIDLPIRRSIPYRISPFLVRNVCFVPIRTGFAHFLYGILWFCIPVFIRSYFDFYNGGTFIGGRQTMVPNASVDSTSPFGQPLPGVYICSRSSPSPN